MTYETDDTLFEYVYTQDSLCALIEYHDPFQCAVATTEVPMTELVFQNEMNGGVAFSAKGRGMWTVDGREDTLTDGLRFAAASATAVHPFEWENAQAPATPVTATASRDRSRPLRRPMPAPCRGSATARRR